MSQKVFQEPKQIDPQAILVAPSNRDGAPPNVQHVHHGILKSIVEQGFDSTRPSIGICVEFKSPEAKRKLLEHNIRFSHGNSLMPKIDETKALYGSIAGSHLNLSLRLIQQGSLGPAGDLSTLEESNKGLADVVQNGHKWWILKEDTDLASQVDVSLWRNMDQIQNHGTHEVEILQTIVSTASLMRAAASASSSSGGDHVRMADLVARVSRRTPAKVSMHTLQSLVKYFAMHLQEGTVHLIQELVDYHAAKVNPKALVVGSGFFTTLTIEEALNNKPLLRHYMLLSQYTLENAVASASGPSLAKFLDKESLGPFFKKPEILVAIDTAMSQARDKYLPLLEAMSNACGARQDLAVYADLLIRCAVYKPWPKDLVDLMGKVPTGKFSLEKVKFLEGVWAQWIETHRSWPSFRSDAGIPVVREDGETPADEDLLNLGTMPGEPDESEGIEFKRGDEVKTIRRLSWKIAIPGSEPTKVDIPEGTADGTQHFQCFFIQRYKATRKNRSRKWLNPTTSWAGLSKK